MKQLEFRTPLFFLTGFTWLLLSSLMGLGLLYGTVLGTPLPQQLRLIHVHGALVGGVAQIILGAMIAFIPPLLMTGRDRSESHPVLYGTMNLGTIALLAGFGLGNDLVVALGGFLVIGAFLSFLGEGLKQARSSLVSPPLNLWFYGVAVLVLLIGLGVGESIILGLVDVSHIGQARLVHIHLNLLGFVTLTIIGTMHNLFPTVLNTRLYSPLLARATFFLLPAGVVILFTGFMIASLWTQIAAGGLLIVGSLVHAYNIFRTWLGAGGHSNIAADHLMAATVFLILAVTSGVLVSVNYLWDPPRMPFGTLHLMAYTHLGLVGFILQTIFGALSHLLPTSFAVGRVKSHNKRGAYLEQLERIAGRLGALQVGTLTLGTLGLAVIASLVWQFPLGSTPVKTATWTTIILLFISLFMFSVKVGALLSRRPSQEVD